MPDFEQYVEDLAFDSLLIEADNLGVFHDGKGQRGYAMKAQTPINVIESALTPQQRAEGHRRCQEHLDDYVAKLTAKRERQRRQATAQNEIELTGENHESDETERQ
jgi:hypothetical protein